jgi:hypothetical protein
MAYCVNGCWTVSNRIGIGTESPSTALHIIGVHTSGLGIINAISSDSSILNLDSATADARVRLKYQGNERWFAGMSDTQFNYHIQNATTGNYGLAISFSTGDVGINTCTPQGYGHGGTNKILEIANTNTTANAQAHIILTSGATTNAGSVGTITWAGPNFCTAKRAGIIAVLLESGTCTTPQSAMQFYTSDTSNGITERMRLTSTGYLGIGLTNPATKLHVYGSHVGGRGILELQSADDALIAIRKSSGASGMRFQDFNGTDRWFVGEFSDCNIHIMDCFTSAKSRLTITRPGNVGINTCNPETTLHMTADSPYVYMDDTSTGSNRKRIKLVAGDVGVIQSFSIAFSCTNNTCQVDAMFVTENASVGINTACPGAYKLNVNGAFYAAGSSKEYKTSICEYNTDSCMFMKLKPVTYDYKEEWKHLGKQLKSGTQIGLIAEDTAEVFPELAVLKEEENLQVVRNVDYEKLSIVLLAEVQKLRKEVDDLKTK